MKEIKKLAKKHSIKRIFIEAATKAGFTKKQAEFLIKICFDL